MSIRCYFCLLGGAKITAGRAAPVPLFAGNVSFPQIELPPFRAQLVVQLLVQLAGALLHLSRAEFPETVGGLETVLLGYLPERAVVVVFQVPPYLSDALLPQPFVGGLAVYLAEFLAEGRVDALMQSIPASSSTLFVR